MTNNSKTQLTLPSDVELVLVRDFRAPRPLVFDMWSTPEHVARWVGCPILKMTFCEIDFREGGRWRWVLENRDDGVKHGFSGEYREIVRPNRLVFTEQYENIPGRKRLVTHTLDEHGGVTTLTSRHLYPSKEYRDGHLKSGMQTGLDAMFDRLDAFALSLAAAP